MYQLTQADMIWNRACGEDPLRSLPGDRALADMLRAHNLIMNGGVLHAIECLTASELSDAEAGYSYYGFDGVTALLTLARERIDADDDLGGHEHRLDALYAELVPSDNSIVERFEQRLKLNPFEFASLRARDMA
ncbi:MAG: hypothetical protein WCH39_14335 [Schlesneria sp.]